MRKERRRLGSEGGVFILLFNINILFVLSNTSQKIKIIIQYYT